MAPSKKKITKAEIKTAQKQWGDAIVDIGKKYMDGKDVVAIAKSCISNLYNYSGKGKGKDDDEEVLFKPTKCEVIQFRPTLDGAISYFVGDDFADLGFTEDKGFAIAPYKAVHFKNSGYIFDGNDRAIAMGNYFFVKLDGTSVKVEYTFGYRRKKGKDNLVIDLHHSSIPYSH